METTLVQGIDIGEVKRYNSSLKQYQEQASQIRAGIDYNTKELDRLCKELSAELGVTVTPENIREIRNERIAKIHNTLEVGNEILQRIKSEEEAANAPQNRVQTPVMGAAPSPMMGGMGTHPPQAPMGGMPMQAPMGTTPPQAPFGGQAPNPSIFENIGNIPPIFGAK